MASRRTARLYLLVQGTSVLVWWVALVTIPALERVFLPTYASPAFLYAFLPGDVLIVGLGSLAAARAWKSSAPPRLLFVVTGALGYATVYVFGLWIAGELTATGPMLMMAASIGTVWTLTAQVAA